MLLGRQLSMIVLIIGHQKKVCKNTFDIGHCPVGKTGLPISQGTVDFSGANYKGENGDYNKCKWTKQCNASWDGIDSQCA